MHRQRILRSSIAAILIVFVFSALPGRSFATDPTPMTIADIMEATHKRPRDGGEMLLKKVALGDANATEKQVLLDRYKALAKLKPAKGDAADWEARTKRLVDAAEAAVKGKPGSDKQLQRAANCMACHNEHKAS